MKNAQNGKIWQNSISNTVLTRFSALRFSALTQFSAQFQVTKFLFYINKTLNLVNSPGLVHNFWVTKKCTKSSDHCSLLVEILVPQKESLLSKGLFMLLDFF